MPSADAEFQRKLLATFREEASEHLEAMARGLIALEKTPIGEERTQIIEKVFREAHSLKGAARAVDLKAIESVCQSMEGVFARAKRGEITIGADELDLMHRSTDEVQRLLQSATGEAAPVQDARLAAAAVTASDQTVRVSSDMLDRLLLQVEELVPATMAVAHRVADLQGLSRESLEWKREWGKVQGASRSVFETVNREGASREKRASTERKLQDFLEWNEEFVRRVQTSLGALARSGARDQRSLGSMVELLLQDTKVLLLRPFSSLTDSYPRVVRDLCREQGKEASLAVHGSEIEVDRRILQEIKDPFLHLLRNCIDHGIEKPEERERAGKAPRGVIQIDIELKSASRVEVSISDDGSGINPRRVREAVVRAGLLDAASAQEIGEQEILPFIFQSGVSTSPIVTDISGRGLGMAIVREKVERLGGEVVMETRLGAGTTFRLLLPLTVSTVRGLLVRVGEQTFVIPITFVERVARTKRDAVQTVENRDTVLLQGRPISFVPLREVLGMPADQSAADNGTSVPIAVLASAEHRIAFRVDEVVGEQELLVKTLGPQLVRVRNIAGAAVLGTGKVVPILNVADLMKSAVKAGHPRAAEGKSEMAEPSKQPRRRAVLVVDDSITARTLLKTILESAGYLVRTAVDGAEAFATLRETEFDVVVSDVDMPRLNGFDLTAKIRADRKLADLPVVLVTALESRQDRERGIDVGASAYIVKSSFEQSNLLEVVRRYA